MGIFFKRFVLEMVDVLATDGQGEDSFYRSEKLDSIQRLSYSFIIIFYLGKCASLLYFDSLLL